LSSASRGRAAAAWLLSLLSLAFEAGDLDGRRLGRRVGASAWAKARRYFGGTAVDPVG
jgi:hypothetical protein